jgi:hypothetical protein
MTSAVDPKLIPWSTGLLERLIAIQLDKKFPVFYVLQKFMPLFTRTRH